jgi:hypothetical protein
MQCILYKIYFWKIFHKYYNLICTPICTKFYSCKKWVLQWLQCLEAISDPEGPHFHAGLVAMAEYVQYSFDLQHTTARTAIQ